MANSTTTRPTTSRTSSRPSSSRRTSNRPRTSSRTTTKPKSSSRTTRPKSSTTSRSPSRPSGDRTSVSKPEKPSRAGKQLAENLGAAFMTPAQRLAVDGVAENFVTARDGLVNRTSGELSQQGVSEAAQGRFDGERARRTEGAMLNRRFPGEAERSPDLINNLADLRATNTERNVAELGRDSQLLDRLDVANSERDGEFSHGDLNRAAFEHDQQQGFEPGRAARGSSEWADESNRGAEVIRAQEQSVLDSVVQGRPVQFTNSDGNTESLQFEQLRGANEDSLQSVRSSRFVMTGANGHQVNIQSNLSPSDNRTALARIGEYYTRTPEHLRDSVNSIRLTNEADEKFISSNGQTDAAAANYGESPGHVNFFNGLSRLNEDNFNHEYGHAIGDKIDGDRHQLRTENWDSHSAERPSEYAGTNEMEDFAESYSMFKEYSDNGRLDEFRERFPHRARELESIFSN